MRIWRQNMVAIVPLFLCLALAISGLVYQFVKRELVRGLQEESQAAAISIAAFSEQLLAGDRSIESIEQSVDRALSYGSILRVTVFQSGEPLIDRGITELSGGETEDTTEPFETSDGQVVIGAAAPVIHGATEAHAGNVIVYMDAARLPEGLAEVVSICMIGSLLTVVLGIAASALVSLALRKEMEPLGRAVAAIANGSSTAAMETTANARGIREIIDLRNTVATMGSVLDWTMHKSQLLVSCAGDAPVSGSRQLAEKGAEGMDVSVHLLPVDQASDDRTFLETVRSAGGELIAFFGSIDACGDQWERRMRAGAVVHYLRSRLSKRSCCSSDILQRCAILFDLSDLTLVRCDIARAQAFEVFRLRADRVIDHESIPSSESMHLFHNGGRHLDALFKGLTASLPAMSAAELTHRATALLDHSSQMLCVVIGSIAFDPKPSSTVPALSTSSLATSHYA
ncbi:MAG: hypothetical protein KDN22_12385 [Verrucomicrobiae bacterium]|nr:hypothetical protein [Verrucomicrobiae bacterium]